MKTTKRIVYVMCGVIALILLFCSSNNVYAEEGDYFLYPIKEDNTLSNNSDNRLDIGFATAEMGHSQIQVGLVENYYEHVDRMVARAINNVQSYFSKEVRINDTRSYFLDFFKSYGYQYFNNREDFLNVYVRFYDQGTYLEGDLVYQLCKGFDGISNANVIVRHYTAVDYELTDDITLYGARTSGSQIIEGLWLPKTRNLLLSTSDANSNLYNGSNHITSSFNNYYNNYYSNTNNFLIFYNASDTSVLFYCQDHLNGLYILPLYLDSPVYFPLSFVTYVDDVEVHGDFSYISNNPLYFYTPGTVQANSNDFSVDKWSAGEFNSGIVYGSNFVNPYLTPTPIPIQPTQPIVLPTFQPFATPTPITGIIVPTYNTDDDTGSVISYALNNVTSEFLKPIYAMVVSVINYMFYNNIWFSFLVVAPSIAFIVFIIGRLRKK